MDITCLGALLMDFFPAEIGLGHAEVSAFRPVPGGAPANVAVAAARLGAQAAFLGKVGDDAFGHQLAATLAREGVSTRGLRFDPHTRTTLNFLAQPDVDTYECLFYRNPGADTCLQPGELDRDLLANTRAFHFDSLCLTDEPSRSAALEAAAQARAGGALVSFDVNYRAPLWGPEAARVQIARALPLADLLKLNEAELELLGGNRSIPQAVAGWLASGPSLVVVTRGPAGSQVFTAQGMRHVPAFRVATRDATGCGDAFVAGLLTRLLAADDWRAQLELDTLAGHLRFANAVGALTALQQGVIPALPSRAAVDDFLYKERS